MPLLLLLLLLMLAEVLEPRRDLRAPQQALSLAARGCVIMDPRPLALAGGSGIINSRRFFLRAF